MGGREITERSRYMQELDSSRVLDYGDEYVKVFFVQIMDDFELKNSICPTYSVSAYLVSELGHRVDDIPLFCFYGDDLSEAINRFEKLVGELRIGADSMNRKAGDVIRGLRNKGYDASGMYDSHDDLYKIVVCGENRNMALYINNALRCIGAEIIVSRMIKSLKEKGNEIVPVLLKRKEC